ncbi:prolipoprotein diacylglyceryl transferase [Corynebacterium hadale]|uniref:Phosphatidylglycerol--prolipoprotein diacylglyceryl transferase n=1 Tax=Corynebacterium hadale TaxID=2026255 RepID=A0ABX4HCS7_9CORY|nr:prolipoprotein diacylglyceryl transferase [Corynebacterium hadale]MCG7254403.1 prolipoprotein diacylglyceryl transferase [Corynebacterium hadale]MCG7256613.1 prolipoprotein diacylglyceryl transferase [Corynebacterium hadale]MCG7264157.1 prolipoprotein diacylglyceryl transferase [Corynebacterium hadale]PAT07196.1 prolipoprotein diacylglyceryl transferase [Corynebacterium hadale]
METFYLANIPSPPQGVWHLGPVPIRAYALCIITGILAAMWLGVRRYKARGGDPDVVWDAAIVAIPAGIVGGRLYHVITDHEKYFGPGKDPLQALNITAGGLGIWGAVALGTLAVWALMRYRKVPFAPLADALAPGVVLAQGIGRLGNWFNQELYGAETDVPWALDIYYRVDESGKFAPLTGHSTGEVLTSVHPTFLYELVWNLLVCALLLWADRRFRLGHGRVFWLYVAGYTFGRFFVELMRSDEATMIFGQRVNTWVSAIVFLIAVILFLRLPEGRETTAQVRSTRGSSPVGGEAQEDTAECPIVPERSSEDEKEYRWRPEAGPGNRPGHEG